MYKIKQKPGDFIVEEITDIEYVVDGDYAVFILNKTGYNTLDIIQKIADYLRIKSRQVGYAGNKDKNAMTTQLITVPKQYQDKLSKFKISNQKIIFKGYSKKPLFLGDLIGNSFGIFIRNLTKKQAKDFDIKYRDLGKVKIINYFGEQRFSKNNADIGEVIVKGDFKKAIELIDNNRIQTKIKQYLGKHKNDFVGALKLVPDKLLKFFVHAYQSKIWNYVAKEYIGDKDIKDIGSIKILLLGFGSEISDELSEIYNNIMKREKIVLRDFIIKPLPHLSQEGDSRDLFVYAEDFEIAFIINDDLNKDRLIIKVLFKLQKGSYATEVVRQVLG